MDPYSYARQQGQVIGAESGEDEADTYRPEDLLDLLLYRYARAGRLGSLDRPARQAVGDFAAFANDFLAENRVASTGMVDGEFSLVFEDGTPVPLASRPEARGPARPETAVPITTPRSGKMRGMPVRDDSVPITGRACPARRRPT